MDLDSTDFTMISRTCSIHLVIAADLRGQTRELEDSAVNAQHVIIDTLFGPSSS